MSKKHFTIFVLAMILGMVMFNATAVNATLIVLNEDIVQDDRGTGCLADDQFWLRDVSLFANMTYYEQIDAIEAFTGPSGYYGEWRMAQGNDIGNVFEDYTTTEIMEVFGNYYGRWDYLLTSGDGVVLCDAWATNAADTLLHTIADQRSPNLGAWVVADSITHVPAPVPEPATLFLLGTGLLGIVGASRKKFKKS